MRKLIITAALAGAVSACAAPTKPNQGMSALNVPVVAKTDYVWTAAAPGGSLSAEEAARLDGWFSGMALDYGDSIYVAGDYSPYARRQVSEIAGRYGLLLSPGAPAAAGTVSPDTVTVVVTRKKAFVPNCPNWSEPSNPNYANASWSNYGCGVNSNFAMQVADPEDLLRGRRGPAAEDAETAAKAIIMYRNWPQTAIKPGQELRPWKWDYNLTRLQ